MCCLTPPSILPFKCQTRRASLCPFLNPNEPILIDAPLIPIIRALHRVRIDLLPEVELEVELLQPIEQFLDAYYDTYLRIKVAFKEIFKRY